MRETDSVSAPVKEAAILECPHTPFGARLFRQESIEIADAHAEGDPLRHPTGDHRRHPDPDARIVAESSASKCIEQPVPAGRLRERPDPPRPRSAPPEPDPTDFRRLSTPPESPVPPSTSRAIAVFVSMDVGITSTVSSFKRSLASSPHCDVTRTRAAYRRTRAATLRVSPLSPRRRTLVVAVYYKQNLARQRPARP